MVNRAFLAGFSKDDIDTEDKFITHIEYPLDKEYMLNLAEGCKEFAKPYKNTYRTTKRGNHNWIQTQIFNDSYIKKICQDFLLYKSNIDVPEEKVLSIGGTIPNFSKEKFLTPRFYFQTPNYTLPWHTDKGSQCSINFVLSDDNKTKVLFENDGGSIFNYKYKQAILNTSKRHSVNTFDEERIIFKISIKEQYESFVNNCKYRK